MDKKYTLKQKIRYWFDNLMSKGTLAMAAILLVVTVAVVIPAGILATVISLGGKRTGILENIWVSTMHAIDSGNLAADTGSIFYVALMAIVTLCGLLITSVLIGIINSGLEGKMRELRKGHSEVLESGHTIVLGFGSNIYTIIGELIEANANHKNMAVVVMDPEFSKSDMEDAIKLHIPDTKTTRVICRSGNIADFTDLSICGFDRCSSVIINTDDDFVTIKSILAVTNLLKKFNSKAHLTAVIKDIQNYDAACIAGEGYAEILGYNDVIARIIAHTLYQPGRSVVLTDLFDYNGDEIYAESVDGVEGIKFEDVNLYLPQSIAIGIERDNEVLINPDKNLEMQKGDKLIVIAEDDGLSALDTCAAGYDPSIVSEHKDDDETQSNVLILGYAPELKRVLQEYDKLVANGSKVLVCLPNEYIDKAEEINGVYQNINIAVKICAIYNKTVLHSLLSEDIEAVLVLSNQDVDSETEDAKTFLLLLQLKSISEHEDLNFTVTCEMQISENRQLAEVTNVNDFVVSSNITSHIMTQISQTRELSAIFREILAEEGSEIHIKPSSRYVKSGTQADVYSIGMAVLARNEIFIGIRRVNPDGSYDIKINIPKSEVITVAEDDSFIVVSED